MDSAPVGPVRYLRVLSPLGASLPRRRRPRARPRNPARLPQPSRVEGLGCAPRAQLLGLDAPAARAVPRHERTQPLHLLVRPPAPQHKTPVKSSNSPKIFSAQNGWGAVPRKKSGVGGPYGTGGLAAVWGEARFCLPIGGGAPVMLRGSCSALGSDDSSKLCREHGAVNLSCAIRVLWRVCLWVWRGCVPRCWAR